MRILILGDSHTGVLHKALEAIRERSEADPACDITARQLCGGHHLREAFWREAGDHAEIIEPLCRKHCTRLPPEEPVDALGLCMPLWPMRVVRKLVLGELSLVERVRGRQSISRAAFRRMVSDDQQHILGLAAYLSGKGNRVFAVSAPGLFRDHVILKRADPSTVLGIFEAFREVVRDQLHGLGIDIVDIPSECLDGEGFMKSQFRHRDPDDEHHANIAFGELMIRGIERWARDTGRL